MSGQIVDACNVGDEIAFTDDVLLQDVFSKVALFVSMVHVYTVAEKYMSNCRATWSPEIQLGKINLAGAPLG